jgi:hypothetical protein
LALIAAVMGGTVLAAHLAPEARRPPGPPSTASAFEQDPACLEWGDGCRICVRTPAGPSCSTAGFACVKEAPRCTLR